MHVAAARARVSLRANRTKGRGMAGVLRLMLGDQVTPEVAAF